MSIVVYSPIKCKDNAKLQIHQFSKNSIILDLIHHKTYNSNKTTVKCKVSAQKSTTKPSKSVQNLDNHVVSANYQVPDNKTMV